MPAGFVLEKGTGGMGRSNLVAVSETDTATASGLKSVEAVRSASPEAAMNDETNRGLR